MHLAIKAIRPEGRILLTGVPGAEAKAQLGHTAAADFRKSFPLGSILATLR